MILSRIARPLLAAALLLSSSSLFAGPSEPPPAPAPSDNTGWEFRLEPYAWLAGINGTTGILGVQFPTDLSFRDIASHLKMTYSGQFELRYNRWGLLLDGFYADIGGYIPVRDPRIRQFAIDDKTHIFQAMPNYRAWRSNRGFFDLVAGIRVMSQELRLTGFRDISFGEGEPDFRYFNRSGKKTWIDGVVGARGQYFLYQGLYAAGYVDVGGGSSSLTWQVQGTLGYKFTKLVSAELGWRLLSDNYQSGGFTYNVKQQGLFTGVSFTW